MVTRREQAYQSLRNYNGDRQKARRTEEDVIVASTDPYYNNVVFLLGSEGVDGATTLLDESSSPVTLTTVGGVQIDTAQAKFGTSSVLFTGTGCLTAPDSADWDLSDANADPLTIDGWIRPHAASNMAIAGQGSFGGNTLSWVLWFSAARQLAFYTSAAGNAITNTIGGTGTQMTLDTWYHIAVDKDAAGKIRLYVDDTMVGSATPANSTFFNSTGLLQIGRNDTVSDFNGWMQELRITKGTGRYISDSGLIVPTEAYPRA